MTRQDKNTAHVQPPTCAECKRPIKPNDGQPAPPDTFCECGALLTVEVTKVAEGHEQQ